MYIDEREVFATALEISDEAERASYLATACGESPGMRERVERLLGAHNRFDGLLDTQLTIDADEIERSAFSPGAEIGQYKIGETLGEGGFGIVYRAEQCEPLRRDVALKVIKPGFESQQVIKRFETELQTLGRMEHPHIAQVFDAGMTDEDQPFFAMELVAGMPITEYCEQHELAIDERLDLFACVCRAIQHAHEKGVIHRDIKPSNVLVTQKDGLPFPKIIDFGIALIAADEQESSDGHWIGSPAYMSPEEIESGGDEVGVRTDVYGLGLLLYELIAGRNPHWHTAESNTTVQEVRRRILEDDVRAPSHHMRRTNPAIQTHHDLDCISLKCLHRNLGQRYDSALSLAKDIERFRQHETVAARPSSFAYRTRKFAQRNRKSLMMWGATAAVIAAILIPTTLNRFHRATQQRQQIENSLAEANRLHYQALNNGSGDVESITLAVSAARRAESLLEVGSYEDDLIARVNECVSRLVVEEKERKFLATIERAQIHFLHPDPAGRERTRNLLYEAFTAIEIEADGTSPQEAADKLAERSEELQGYAIAALDIWAVLYCQDAPKTRAWLRETVDIADKQPWRSALRKALDLGDTSVLERLANSEELDAQSPSSLILLANALRQTKSRRYIATLHRAADAYPNVLFFNLVLGNHYNRVAQNYNSEATQKAIHYLSASMALRPNDNSILNNLSMNLSRTGDHRRATNLLRRTVESQPSFWIGWHNLGLTYTRQGNYAAAFDAHHAALCCVETIGGGDSIEPFVRKSVAGLRAAILMGEYDDVFDDNIWKRCNSPLETDEELWQTGRRSFGTPLLRPRTPWVSPELCIKKSFRIENAADTVVMLRALGSVEISVDGKIVVSTTQFRRDDPRLVRLPLLASGDHELMLHVRAIGRERYIEARVLHGMRSATVTKLRGTLSDRIDELTDASVAEPQQYERRQQIIEVLEAFLARKSA